mgnify:CR=1 FL=1
MERLGYHSYRAKGIVARNTRAQKRHEPVGEAARVEAVLQLASELLRIVPEKDCADASVRTRDEYGAERALADCKADGHSRTGVAKARRSHAEHPRRLFIEAAAGIKPRTIDRLGDGATLAKGLAGVGAALIGLYVAWQVQRGEAREQVALAAALQLRRAAALLDEEGWTPNNHYHSFLLKRVPRNCDNALEVGCGTGTFARQLAARCRQVIGLDLSSEMIRVARSRSSQFDNVDFQLADAMTWTFPQSNFDFICSIATLHHLDPRELLMKMKDALKPRGVLVVLDLVQSNGLVERMFDVIGLGVSSSLRLIHNGRLQPPPEVRRAWEQHGKHDSYYTISQIRSIADELLPGASVTRHLLWRYTLVYQKP